MKKIKTYKGFDKDLKCKDFQYEVGKSYHFDGQIEICLQGFHSCLNPYDVLDYYSIADSRFCECEISGEIQGHSDDSKQCSSDIKIVRELSQKEYNLILVDYLIDQAKELKDNKQSGYGSKQSQSGDGSQQSQSGDGSKQSQSGYGSKQSQSGYRSQQSQSGYRSQQSQSGYRSKQSQSGNGSQQSQSGDRSQQSQSGDGSQQSQSGDGSKQCSCGNDSIIEAIGLNNVASAIGQDSKIKGVIGTWINLAEYDNDGKCIYMKSAMIDGKKLKADTIYILKNKKFEEVK